MTQYIVYDDFELEYFDTEDEYMYDGDDYTVICDHTGEVLSPVYSYRSNGDMDGFEGWR